MLADGPSRRERVSSAPGPSSPEFIVISLALILILIAAVAGSGLLSGWMVWMMSRTRRLEATPHGSEDGLLSGRLDELAAELSAVRRQLDDLEQRTDFNERLLEDRAPDQLPPVAPEE
jgi:hypothetical protein